MNRRAVVRHVMLGALVTGLAPLTGAWVDAAGAKESPAALCQSMFGERGPAGGSVVGEGPSGDPMSTTIGWDPSDWSDGLSEIVTCVSVGGRAVPSLTTSLPTPRNDGSRAIRLTLPPGTPGSLVCEQSVLVGAGDAAGRHRTTSPACFKLRVGESPVGSGGPVADGAMPPAPAAPAGPPAPVKAAAPVPYPASTPPARAAFEAARSGTGLPAARPESTAPTASAADPAPAWPPDPAPAARAARSTAPPARAGSAAAQPAAGAPVAALARTGIEEHIPLASAGGFLALGGAAIIFGAPRRRRPARRSV